MKSSKYDVDIKLVRTMDINYPYSFILTIPEAEKSYVFNFPETFGRAMLKYESIYKNEIIGFCNSVSSSCVTGILGFGIDRLTRGAVKPFKVVCTDKVDIRILKKHSLIRKGRIESMKYVDSITNQAIHQQPQLSGVPNNTQQTPEEIEKDKNTLVNSFDFLIQNGDKYSDEWVEIETIPTIDGSIILGYRINFLTDKEKKVVELSRRQGKNFVLSKKPERVGSIIILNPYLLDCPCIRMQKIIECTFRIGPFFKLKNFNSPTNNDTHKIFIWDYFINDTVVEWLNGIKDTNNISLFILSTRVQEGEMIYGHQLFNKYLTTKYKNHYLWDGLIGFTREGVFDKSSEGEMSCINYNSESKQQRSPKVYELIHKFTICKGYEEIHISIPKINKFLKTGDNEEPYRVDIKFKLHDELRHIPIYEYMNSLKILCKPLEPTTEIPTLANIEDICDNIPFLKYSPMKNTSNNYSENGDSDLGETSYYDRGSHYTPDNKPGITQSPLLSKKQNQDILDIEENVNKLSDLQQKEKIFLENTRPKNGLCFSENVEEDEDIYINNINSQENNNSKNIVQPLNSSEYPKIVMLGSGSKATETRNFTSFLLFLSTDYIILVDCGEGTLSQMMQLYRNDEWIGGNDLFNRDRIYRSLSNNLKISNFMDKKQNLLYILTHIRAIFITHEHSDHYYGLYSFLEMRTRIGDYMFYYNFKQTKEYFEREHISEALPIFYNQNITHTSHTNGSHKSNPNSHGYGSLSTKNQTLYSYIEDLCSLISERRCPDIKRRPICVPVDMSHFASSNSPETDTIPSLSDLLSYAQKKVSDFLDHNAMHNPDSSLLSKDERLKGDGNSSNIYHEISGDEFKGKRNDDTNIEQIPKKKQPLANYSSSENKTRLLNSVYVLHFDNYHTTGSVGYIFGYIDKKKPVKKKSPAIIIFSGDCDTALYSHKTLEMMREKLLKEVEICANENLPPHVTSNYPSPGRQKNSIPTLKKYQHSSTVKNMLGDQGKTCITVLIHECTLGYRRTLTSDDSIPLYLNDGNASFSKKRSHASLYDAVLAAILLKCNYLVLNHLSERLNGIGPNNKIYNLVYNFIDDVKEGRKSSVGPILKELCREYQISKANIKVIVGLDFLEISKESADSLTVLSHGMLSDFKQD